MDLISARWMKACSDLEVEIGAESSLNSKKRVMKSRASWSTCRRSGRTDICTAVSKVNDEHLWTDLQDDLRRR